MSHGIPDYNVPIIQYDHGSGFRGEIKLVKDPLVSEFVLKHYIILPQGKVTIAFRMKLTSSYNAILVEVTIVY